MNSNHEWRIERLEEKMAAIEGTKPEILAVQMKDFRKQFEEFKQEVKGDIDALRGLIIKSAVSITLSVLLALVTVLVAVR